MKEKRVNRRQKDWGVPGGGGCGVKRRTTWLFPQLPLFLSRAAGPRRHRKGLSLSLPACPRLGIFQYNTAVEKLMADSVGARKVPGVARRLTLLNAFLYIGVS
jgi:hypothetical protein